MGTENKSELVSVKQPLGAWKKISDGQTKEMKSHNASELHRTTYHREVYGGGGGEGSVDKKMKCPNPTGQVLCFFIVFNRRVDVYLNFPCELTMVK